MGAAFVIFSLSFGVFRLLCAEITAKPANTLHVLCKSRYTLKTYSGSKTRTPYE
jgi:hypothetical protein